MTKNKKTIIIVIAAILATIIVALLLCLTSGGDSSSNEDLSSPQPQEAAVAMTQVADVFSNAFSDNDSFQEKYDKTEALLRDLESEGYISTIQYTDEQKMFCFEYSSGDLGFIALEELYTEGEWSAPATAGIANTTDFIPMTTTKSTTTSTTNTIDSDWLFMCYSNSFKDPIDGSLLYQQYLSYQAAGVNADFVSDFTIEDFLNLDSYDLIYIMGHGLIVQDSPNTYILTEEICTEETQSIYSDMGLFEDGPFGIGTTTSNGITYYYISSDFFDKHYQNKKMDNSIVLMTHCAFFGFDGQRNNTLAQSFINAGASTVVGFYESVNSLYVAPMYEEILYSLIKGDTIRTAFDNACAKYGANQQEYAEKAHLQLNASTEPILWGNDDKRVVFHRQDQPYPYGSHSIIFKDEFTHQPIEGVRCTYMHGTLEKFDGYYIGLSNANGVSYINLPEGSYECQAEHPLYETKSVSTEVLAGVSYVVLNDIYLSRTSFPITFTVQDEVTRLPISGIKVEAIFNETDGFDVVNSGFSDSNGVVSLTLPYGSYSFSFTHDDYNFYGTSVDVTADTLVIDPILMKPVDPNNGIAGVSLEDMPIIDHSSYQDNEGDSTVFNLGADGLTQNDDGHTFSRYGNIGVDGTVYNNGFEVWIARWNYRDEISWASATFDLGGKYKHLTGKTGLIQSYNTNTFDTTIYFYDGNKLLASYRVTDKDYNQNISVDVTGVNALTLYVKDNIAARGGTSFALYNMFLDAPVDTYPGVTPSIYPGQCINLTFRELKNLFGDDFSAFVDEGPVQEGYIHVEFTNAPYSFVFNPHLDGWKSLSQAEIEAMINNLSVTYICVTAEDAIFLLPDYPYTNCESYNSLLGKGAVFSYEEDEPFKTVEFQSNGVRFYYQWNGTDSENTLTHTVYLYPII